EVLLLLRREHRLAAQLLDVEIQQVAIIACHVHRSPPAPAAPALVRSIHMSSRSTRRSSCDAGARPCIGRAPLVAFGSTRTDHSAGIPRVRHSTVPSNDE